ncbi:Transcriptional regulator, contains XRE-family HTH domain [Tistlia consotensis]|uniref:Transcriptional regulator, contains XRE-family HTH domain n=1 Tax=Tistlia consotensis USBA 355 TaxID=560819 RepID=A0A1Y6B5L7_9PROT|nr:helix-turn-helix transcriptional regulator [Tistlia consotensis]SME88940.1 Transcriptional regulator, contains XRE-family HTH domain [Tistlia consotensis USBA 355]SNR25479.1 Transcriptional regulator, contains XRE-family HTH domain [Tistlia consotensis]
MYHKTDVHIGRKVRERRVALGWSQSDLADRLGISFQQVQKYESGANRISGSRIWDIANVLQTPVSTFFEGLDGANAAAAAAGGEEERSFDRQTLELARAVNQIDDEQVKTQLIRLVKAFAKAA